MCSGCGLWLAVQAYEANQDLEITLEQPQDPDQCKKPPPEVEKKIPGWNGFPSFLAWPETDVMVKRCQLQRVHFHQGALRHQSNKRTTVPTSMKEMFDLQGLVSKGSSVEWPPTYGTFEFFGFIGSWA